eukprot:TRINITY_DN269_c0_g1_i2.p1 TRINITY_DN269_c0_g1~~TRINITY_DN269_c0_g1_i2.p1  ORF type:complete len:361 (+),score=72.24 TRINITY_DN269_c0_g1_i2:402-1484(+)
MADVLEGVFGGDEEDEFDFGTPLSHCAAGAIAGVAEHCGMYPLDTLKTHIQAYKPGSERKIPSVIQTSKEIFRSGGIRAFFRGLTAMASGAGPAHAVYFGVYEGFKDKFGGNKRGHQPLATGAAGVIAQVCADTVFTPLDSVKQKMQLNVNHYKNMFDCVSKVAAREGLFLGFYAGYTTALTMNVPYALCYFTAYESLKHQLAPHNRDEHRPIHHILAGGGAGILAAAVTNPLDVAKTRLQTQGEVGKTYLGMRDALSKLWLEEGWRGYLYGIRPRMAFHSMSAALCWTTYEYMKRLLLWKEKGSPASTTATTTATPTPATATATATATPTATATMTATAHTEVVSSEKGSGGGGGKEEE